MTAATSWTAAPNVPSKLDLISRGLRRRHARETRFRLLGLLATAFAVAMVAVLFASVLRLGLPAFWQATVTLDVTFDPDVVEIDPRPEPVAGQTPAEYHTELTR